MPECEQPLDPAHQTTAFAAVVQDTALLVLPQPTYASAGSVQNSPFSLHVVYNLLAHEQLGTWILSDIGRTSQIHSHLLEMMDELWKDGTLEASWLTAACVTKTCHCEFVSHPIGEEEEERNTIDGFGRVHECLLDIFQVDPVLCNVLRGRAHCLQACLPCLLFCNLGLELAQCPWSMSSVDVLAIP